MIEVIVGAIIVAIIGILMIVEICVEPVMHIGGAKWIVIV